jgi:predicted porin
MLKKSELLAGAVAAAAAVLSSGVIAAEAKGAVYGDLRYAIDHSDSSGPVSDAFTIGPDQDFRELNGHFGIKGSVSQGSWSAFGVIERYADTAHFLDINRQAYAGLSGPMGTISFGTMFTAYAKQGLAIDPFYNTSLASGAGGMAGSTGVSLAPLLALTYGSTYSSFGLSPLLTADVPGGTRSELLTLLAGANAARYGGVQENQLTYETPSIMGLTFNAGVFFDESDDAANNAGAGEWHDYAVGATWSMNGITASIQHLQINDGGGTQTFLSTPGQFLTVILGGGGLEADATRITAGYSAEQFGVNLSVEQVDNETLGGAQVPNEEYMMLSGWFGVAPGTRIAASW